MFSGNILNYTLFHAAAFGSCHIGADVNNSVGTPYYSRPGNGGLRTVYSCVANDNCNYDVHVIGCYESEYITNRYRSSSYVYIHVQGQSSKPLILVLLTYRPMWWSLRISSDVVIDTVILVSTKQQHYHYARYVTSPSRYAWLLSFLSSCTESTMTHPIVDMI